MLLPFPIITALVSAFAGAILGSFFSDVVTRRRERHSRRLKLVGELAAFYGRCEAALVRFQRIRMADKAGAFTEATYQGLADVSESESEGHRLYWDIREAFRTPAVWHAMWELTRRISHTKQMLMFTESPSAEFAAGMNWINAQCRHVLTRCARHIGLDVERDSLPFFIGLGGIDGLDRKYLSAEPPWADIQAERAKELVDKMWAERLRKERKPSK